MTSTAISYRTFGFPTQKNFFVDPQMCFVIPLYGTPLYVNNEEISYGEQTHLERGIEDEKITYSPYYVAPLYDINGVDKTTDKLTFIYGYDVGQDIAIIEDFSYFTYPYNATEPQQATIKDEFTYNSFFAGQGTTTPIQYSLLVDESPNKPIGVVSGAMKEARFTFNKNTYIEILLDLEGNLSTENIPTGFVLDGKTVKGIATGTMNKVEFRIKSDMGSNIPVYFTVPNLERIG